MNADTEFMYSSYKRSGSSHESVQAFEMRELYPKEDPEKVKILQEIYDTEKSYVSDLLVVEKVFFPRLNASFPSSRKSFRTVFGEISAICKTHQTLLNSLRNHNIADVFTEFTPFLKVYTAYASHYPNAQKLHAQLMARTEIWKTLDAIQKECEGRTLQSYLILPIQRIPRYIMLLQKLMHYCTDQDESRQLFNALYGMQALSDQIQSCMTAFENGERLLAIQLSFGLDSHIVEPGRVLVKEGMLYKRQIVGFTNYEESIVFLFNDILLYGTKKISVLPLCKYEPSAILSLRHCKLQYDDVGGSMLIRCGDVGVDFTADSFEGVTEWYNVMSRAIDNAKKLRDTLRKDSFQHKTMVFNRGVWQKTRDRLSNLMHSDLSAHVQRVFAKKAQDPKLDEGTFLRRGLSEHEYSLRNSTNRKRRSDGPLDKTIETKRVLKEQRRNSVARARPKSEPIAHAEELANVTLTQPNTEPGESIEDLEDANLTQLMVASNKRTEGPILGAIKTETPELSREAIWSMLMSPKASYDEEDRRPRNVGSARKMASLQPAPARLSLGVDDIRKLSYQQRTVEAFDLNNEQDYDEYEAINVQVKGERSRPWWEKESAPPVIQNQKSTILNSVKSACTIM